MSEVVIYSAFDADGNDLTQFARDAIAERDELSEELRRVREQDPVGEFNGSFDFSNGRRSFSVTCFDALPMVGAKLYASPVPAQNWMPIESAPEGEYVLVTGNNMIGDPPEGRFYIRAIKQDDEFISTDDFGEIYNPGYLTHWIQEPKP